MSKPVIGVAGPDRGGLAMWLSTWLAVKLAGGVPVRITPAAPQGVNNLDGLILGGGSDVQAHLYGALPKRSDDPPVDSSLVRIALNIIVIPITWVLRKTGAVIIGGRRIDPARDDLEMELIREAVAKGIPILGICRGEQLLNVFFGGTLHQDLRGFYVEDPEVRTILPGKRLIVESSSLLSGILGSAPQRVNALHRQAIDRLGTGLRITARDRNGIVQAIEHQSYPFIIGVQWHPEFLPQLREQRALFTALVSEAERVRSQGVCKAANG